MPQVHQNQQAVVNNIQAFFSFVYNQLYVVINIYFRSSSPLLVLIDELEEEISIFYMFACVLYDYSFR